MALVSMKQILDEANTENYAVAAFDVVDHASAEAVVQAAEVGKRPVILMFPEAALPLVVADTFFPFLVDLARKSDVPIALHWDHGQQFEAIMQAIHHGFSSVMIDGSSLPLAENIALTKRITEIARAAEVSVEAEIGHVAGGEGSFEGSKVDESMYTDPKEAKLFAEETGVDALAVAIGTVHGKYKGTPKLDVERLKEIKQAVGIPLVLHGGSGVSDEEFKKVIAGGINKINIFTEISIAAVEKSLEQASKRENKLHFAELILAGRTEIFGIASRYLELFGESR